MSMAIRCRHSTAGGLDISINEFVASNRGKIVIKRTILFVFLIYSTATTICSAANTTHKIIVAGMATPGIVVMISLTYKAVKTRLANSTKKSLSTEIKKAYANNYYWLRPQ